jgi:dipeptidyl aminopeptidase/acylaminoacyl peptidase
MKKVFAVLMTVLVPAVVLFLPYFLQNRKQTLLTVTDLSGVKYTEVFFKNDEVKLSGMLFLPENKAPYTVVVFIHGSGTSQRNSPWYLTVAKHLQDNGIAVLLPDKRGSEKSEGDWKLATFQDLAMDAVSAIDYIRTQKLFEYSNIGVMGFSQGGWIAPIVAVEDSSIAFAVSLSGPGVTTDEHLLYEEVKHISEYTYPFIAKLLAPITTKSIQNADWWKKIGGFDPIPYWQKVQIPALMAFGEEDKNVPIRESVKRIQNLNKNNIKIRVYPKVRHGIIFVSQTVRDDFFRDLDNFINSCQTARN